MVDLPNIGFSSLYYLPTMTLFLLECGHSRLCFQLSPTYDVLKARRDVVANVNTDVCTYSLSAISRLVGLVVESLFPHGRPGHLSPCVLLSVG